MKYLITSMLFLTQSVFGQTNCNSYSITDPMNYNAGSMGGYLTLTECYAELDQMKLLYPNLISTKDTVNNFTTFEGRPIVYVKISDNPNITEPEKRILYNSLHHSHEPNSMQQLIYFMWYLLENYNTNPEIRNLVNNTEIICVPVVNPDGYVHNQTTNPTGGGLWRKNRRNHFDGQFGVDPNRNYSFAWGNGTPTSSNNYCGTSAFSEPETQAIKWLCEQNNFTMAVNAHTHGKQIFYPYGYAAGIQTPDSTTYEIITDEMVRHNNYNNILSSLGGTTPGDSDDWMYADTTTKPKIFSLTPEVGGSYWETAPNIIKNNRDMLHTNITALRFVHNYVESSDKSDAVVSQTNFQFQFQLKRLGAVNNQNFNVSILPISTNIVSVSAPKVFANLAFNQIVLDSFQINLAPTISQGASINFKLLINNGTYTDSINISKIYGNTVIVFNEPATNTSQWTTTSGWATTTSTFYTAPSCITESPSGNYADSVQHIITANDTISLLNKSYAELNFYAKWDIENDYDFVVLEVSNDNGLTWIPQCGKFTNNGSSFQMINAPLYDGTQSNWVKETINLSAYLNQTIKFRFRFKSDNNTTGDGFYFDELKVGVINFVPLSIQNIDMANQIQIYPNPANTILNIANNYQLNTYKIIDNSGKIIQTGNISNNQISISAIPNGMYYLQLESKTNRTTKKLLIAH